MNRKRDKLNDSDSVRGRMVLVMKRIISSHPEVRSRTEFAKRIHTIPPTISRWEKHRGHPTLENCITVNSSAVKPQTNVSGGIYTNTTWTLAGSPYIVTGNVVVFPGNTLTIDPGVTVRFDDQQYLEIRQATLVATGTITDSITFTSNNPAPTPGIWGHPNYGAIYFNGSNYRAFGGVTGQYANNSKFYNCSISYNHDGLISAGPIGGTSLHHCVLNFNTGFAAYIQTNDSIVDCEIKYNGTGVGVQSGNSVITHCTIENDTVGLLIFGAASIYCNTICNNISYGLQMNSSPNFSVTNNYWCTTDSLQIAAAIYDGYDNISYGLVTFMPIDTSGCSPVTGIPVNDEHVSSFSIFPNPATSELVVRSSEFGDKGELTIFNVVGNKIFSQQLRANRQRPIVIDVSTLASGIYIIQIVMDNKISRQKFIRQ